MLRAALWLLLAAALPFGCGEPEPPADPEIRVRVQMVALDEHDSPVVILEEENGSRLLPIWVGTAEATSIASQINNLPPPRPNSHDLARSLIRELEAEVERVVVTELRGGTYYALLSLLRDGRRFDIDVRPSDGIAVSSRTSTAISGSDQALAADPDDVAVDRGRRGIGVPRDRLGDVDREPALAHRVEPPTDLSGREGHGRGHLGLDEARCHGVDGDALLQAVDPSEVFGLGRGTPGRELGTISKRNVVRDEDRQLFLSAGLAHDLAGLTLHLTR